tara:strand:- start:212 stop:547 length:336 start_codon:yes stop_codon:yes gene_type:complete
MDLSLLITNETAKCVIIDPYDNKETDIVITIYGPYSKQYSDAFKKNLAREKPDFVELLVDLTASWVNLKLDGKKLVFNRSNAKKIYSMEGVVIAGQVERFVVNNKNFLPKR